MPENTRQYIFSEAQTRLMFVGSGVLMVSAIVGILLLASSRPQGRFLEPNRTQFLTTLNEAAAQLEGGAENTDGTLTLPIESAMELVAERGVANAFTAGGAEVPAEENTGEEATDEDAATADIETRETETEEENVEDSE